MNRLLRSAGPLAILTVLLLTARAESAELNFCNNANRKIWFAVAGFDRDAERLQWRSLGWYGVEQGDCKDYNFGSLLGRHLFVYASDSDGTFWSGDFLFCVHANKAFNVTGDHNCADNGDGFSAKRFWHKTSSNGKFFVNLGP